MSRTIKQLVAATAIAILPGLLATQSAHAAVYLTDSAVFSANPEGNNWNGWIWNTQAPPADVPDRWNMYYSSSLDPQNPVFINSGNASSTNISIEMSPGTHSFLVYGESVTTSLDPLQHFVLSLYFDGNQSSPDISGLYGSACPSVCAAGHPNGLDLFGNSGEQEAGTLVHSAGGTTVTLSAFSWAIGENVDEVWPHWDNTAPYSNGSTQPDFVGLVTLQVSQVPAPGSLPLLALGLAALAAGTRRKRQGGVQPS